jgi:hypothetical protein
LPNLPKDLRELVAQPLGWRLAGTSGSSHIRLQHPDAGHYVVANTPSDRNAYRAALHDLQRLAGEKLPRPASGRYRHRGHTRVLDTTQSRAERAAGAEVDRLIAQARQLRAEFDELGVDRIDDARDVADRYDRVRRDLAERFRLIPPIDSVETP